MIVKFYDQVEDEKLKFAVIAARAEGKWVFCKHKARTTLEAPGGHREPGEPILDTARRELQEETGATAFDLQPVCVYSVTDPDNFDGAETYGLLCTARTKPFRLPIYRRWTIAAGQAAALALPPLATPAARRRTPAKCSRKCWSPAAVPWHRCKAKRSIKTGLPLLKPSGYSPVFAAFAGQKRR